MPGDIEPKIRHLEMIQTVITRMAQNSFALKGWAITLGAGIFALAAKDANKTFFLIAYVPVIVFWFLDSFYLQFERKYRVLYKQVSVKDIMMIDFNMIPPASNWKERTFLIQSFFSPSEICFYLPTALLILIVMIIVGK